MPEAQNLKILLTGVGNLGEAGNPGNLGDVVGKARLLKRKSGKAEPRFEDRRTEEPSAQLGNCPAQRAFEGIHSAKMMRQGSE